MSGKSRQFTEKLQHAIRHRNLFFSSYARSLGHHGFFHNPITACLDDVRNLGGSGLMEGQFIQFGGIQPVKFDGSAVTNQATSGSSIAASITVGSNINRAIVAIVAIDSAPAQTISSISGAANSFTLMGSANGNSSENVTSMYISLDPSTGSNTITANFSGASRGCTIVLLSLYNVDQTTGYYSGNVVTTNNIASGNVSNNITPTNKNSLCVDSLGTENNFSGGNQTLIYYSSTLSSALNSGTQYAPNPLSSLSAITFSWTFSSGTLISCHVIVEIRAFGT